MLVWIQYDRFNAVFTYLGAKFGDKVAKEVAINVATSVASATVGRIPIVGGPMTMVAREIARDELQGLKVCS